MKRQEPPPTWPERLIPPAILLLFLAAALGVLMIPRLRDSASTHAAQAASAQARPTREYRLVGHRIVNKPIAQIEPGDRVLTRDQNDPHGSIVPGEVVETYQPIADHLRLLTLAMPDGSETQFETTDNHPFHVPGRGWVPAGKLRVADEVSTAGEAVAHVQSTAREEHPEGVEVYNFQVEGTHTYFVSAENSTGPPVWVHNSQPCKPAISSQRVGAVRKAWRLERTMILERGVGTVRWTGVQMRELISTGRVKSHLGHHINSVKSHPHLAGDPRNIKFILRNKHLLEHGGDFRNPTYGALIDR